MWAKIVDGFRCDVASFVPVEFWKQAREAVAKVNPDCIWLAESVHSSFNVFSRKSGIYTASDYELLTLLIWNMTTISVKFSTNI